MREIIILVSFQIKGKRKEIAAATKETKRKKKYFNNFKENQRKLSSWE